MPQKRTVPIGMTGADFKQAGYGLIDTIAAFIDDIGSRPVTTSLSAAELSAVIGSGSLPEHGKAPGEIVERAADILLDHSLFNGHPKFFGYITSSAAPIGALADLLAAAVNPNVGAGILSPVATAIEKQVIKWLREVIGLPACYDGLLVSGGNMANFTAFCTAINVRIPGSRKGGIRDLAGAPLVYCSKGTHAWIEKAAAFTGLGTDAIRWIPVDAANRMDISILEQTLNEDRRAGDVPVMVVGTAGDVSTGAVDDLKAIGQVCRRYGCWCHVDGAYGAPAAAVPGQRALFEGMADADSIAMDPHKWLYAPLEAGCVLVKDPNHLIGTYSSHPVYYNFNSDDDPGVRNYYEYGFQNSRGFRALKVWMILQQAGRRGIVEMIAADIGLAERLFRLVAQHAELEAVSHNLSIVTFRYSLPGCPEKELNKLNELLLNDLQRGGEAFLSNAMVYGKYCLRVCIVNFRTSEKDIDELIGIVVRHGRELAGAERP